MSDVRTIRVFIASPGDLAVERAAFQQVLEELNAGFGDALDITFEPLGWEDTLASTGRRSQEVINREIDRCDVFILACTAGGAGGSGRSAVLVVHGRRVSPRVRPLAEEAARETAGPGDLRLLQAH